MSRKPDQASVWAELRRRAEGALRAASSTAAEPAALSLEAAKRLLHDLRVQHIELEMQNDELRRTQLALEATQQRWIDLYEGAPVGYCELDGNAVISLANRCAGKLLGTQPEWLPGKPFTRFISHDDQDLFYLCLKKCLRELDEVSCELLLKRPDGSNCFVQLTASTTPDAPGGNSRVALVDISARKQADAELKQHRDHLEALVSARTLELTVARLRAEAANLAKTRFLANMSHEIRTPLNAILGMSHLIRREGLNPQQGERMNLVEEAGRHLLAIVDEVLDLSKIEAGRAKLDCREFDLQALLRRVAAITIEAGRHKQLRVALDTDGIPQWVRGDATRIQQALLNYTSNAVKFTEAGTIAVIARLLEQVGDTVLLRFDVKDSGPGIAAAEMARLFLPFEQGDASTTRRHGGTGLGLSITRRLAELMGGEAGVESTPGAGSTFWFTARLGRRSDAGPAGS